MNPIVEGADTDNCGDSWNDYFDCFDAKDNDGDPELFDSTNYSTEYEALLSCLKPCFMILKAGLMNTILSALMLL
jgi:hypothetical protein